MGGCVLVSDRVSNNEGEPEPRRGLANTEESQRRGPSVSVAGLERNVQNGAKWADSSRRETFVEGKQGTDVFNWQILFIGWSTWKILAICT